VLDDDVKALLGRGEEKEAATAALRAHGPEILGYLENVLGDHDDARDVFQRFAEDLWTWLPAYRGGSLRAAGYRIAWHAALRFRREAWRRRRERMRTTMASRIAASITSPEARLATQPRDRLARLRRAFCKEQIAHFKVPQHIRFVDQFPMTVTGKIQKYLMRQEMSRELAVGEEKTA
jgi:DNA-directed RNA polymerase specialized sigma24 family protein